MWAAHGGFGAEEKHGLTFEGVQSMLPPMYHAGIRIILSSRQLRKSRHKKISLPSPSLPGRARQSLIPQEKTPGAYQTKDDPRRIYIANLAKTALTLH